MVIDYEKAWLALKEVVLEKRSHGQDDLLGAMTRIEIDCRVPEGQEGFDPGPTYEVKQKPTHAVPA